MGTRKEKARVENEVKEGERAADARFMRTERRVSLVETAAVADSGAAGSCTRRPELPCRGRVWRCRS